MQTQEEMPTNREAPEQVLRYSESERHGTERTAEQILNIAKKIGNTGLIEGGGIAVGAEEGYHLEKPSRHIRIKTNFRTSGDLVTLGEDTQPPVLSTKKFGIPLAKSKERTVHVESPFGGKRLHVRGEESIVSPFGREVYRGRPMKTKKIREQAARAFIAARKQKSENQQVER